MRFLFLLLLMATALLSRAQQITGSVKDESGAPLAGATVSLVKAKDSATIKLAVTNAGGVYSFSAIKEGNYKVKASHVSYRPIFSAGFSFGTADVAVPEFKLIKMPAAMNGVTVTAQKPMVEVKADKTILNVEGTINATGSNALELLRKSPGVLLDKDENLSLAGKNGVQVYIDGRPNPLSGQDLATYLKTLQSTQIEAIELITNPSAKYDAAGNAGIINIKLVRNKSLGMNGSVNAGWNIGIYAKYYTGFSLNYRNAKLNLFSTYNYSQSLGEQNIRIERKVLDSLFDQSGLFTDRRKSHSFKLGADYFIDKRNTIGIMVNGILADPTSTNNGRTYISNTNTGIVDRLLLSDNSTNMKRNNANINLNYSFTDAKKGTSLTLNADRGAYDLDSDQYQRNYYFDPSGHTPQGSIIYHMLSPAQIDIHSVKADYEQNYKKGKLSLGAKSAWVKTDNDFQRFNLNAAVEDLDKDRSNHFIYKENIMAGYLNYNRQYKQFMFQAGLRLEHTVSEGVSNGLKYNGSTYIADASSFKREYTNLFPSAALTFNKNPKKQWSLTYSRRIDRPAYQDLNPFEFKLDEYTFMKGNINLKPQYTNSFGITHTYKYKLNIALNYSHVKDMFVQLIDTTEKSKAFASKKNLAVQDIISLSISYPFQYKSYSLFTSLGSNYSKYEADFGAGRKVNLNAFGLNIFMQHSLKFAKTYTAELTSFYNAPTIYMGSFKGRAMGGVDAGLSKQIMNAKATIKASVSDIFYTQQFRATSDFAGQSMKFSMRPESRQFKLSFNYRFGNTKVKPARQRSTGSEEEIKRVQSGGGVIGG